MSEQTTLYGGASHRRVSILDLKDAKARGEKWAMLTSYEQMTASIFDEAGIQFSLSEIALEITSSVKRTHSPLPSMS